MEKIGIIVSETYADITESMLNIASTHIEFLSARVGEIIRVPGSYDIPLAVKHLIQKNDIDGIVTLGAVIEGDTDHDNIVAQNAARKIMDLSIEYEKPVGLGVSRPKETRMDALKRIDKMSKGAVESCIKMIRRMK